MKRIWLCLGITLGIFILMGYSTFKVRAFADQVTVQVEAAVTALGQDDLPAAHQAVLDGAALCEDMRRSSVLFLRTEDFIELESSLRVAASYLAEGSREDFIELESSLRVAASYLAEGSREEALGELGRAAFQAESIDWLTRRWL